MTSTEETVDRLLSNLRNLNIETEEKIFNIDSLSLLCISESSNFDFPIEEMLEAVEDLITKEKRTRLKINFINIFLCGGLVGLDLTDVSGLREAANVFHGTVIDHFIENKENREKKTELTEKIKPHISFMIKNSKQISHPIYSDSKFLGLRFDDMKLK